MDVSIIIINYKSCQLVMDCINSIVAETRPGTYEIIVVDNDSQDGAQDIILSKHPTVRWIDMKYNAGFSRANNAGMRIAQGEYVLILNADTIILNGAINQSIDQIKAYPGAIGGGVQLLNTDGSNQISGAHFMKGGLNTLLPLPYLGRLIRYLGYQFKSTVPSVQDVANDIEVDWIVGAYIVVKRTILEKSGLFDEDFFMYAEEIEWCARLRKQGKLVLLAAPKVIHIGGGTSGQYYQTAEAENGKNLWNRKGRQIVISNMVRIRKQFGLFWFFVIAGTYLLEIPIFAFCLLVDKIIHLGKSTYSWKNVKDFISNMAVFLTYCPKIIPNKKYFYKVV
jgi:GT2 family glycosyltransferase